MGSIAHLQLNCTLCNKTTSVYVEEGDAERVKVKCEHCKRIFEFGPGTLYIPIGYVTAIPRWALIRGEVQVRQSTTSKKWWEFWK